MKTAELPVMTGSVYLAVCKRASARCVSTGILSPDYLLSPAYQEGEV